MINILLTITVAVLIVILVEKYHNEIKMRNRINEYRKRKKA